MSVIKTLLVTSAPCFTMLANSAQSKMPAPKFFDSWSCANSYKFEFLQHLKAICNKLYFEATRTDSRYEYETRKKRTLEKSNRMLACRPRVTDVQRRDTLVQEDIMSPLAMHAGNYCERLLLPLVIQRPARRCQRCHVRRLGLNFDRRTFSQR